MPVSRGLGNFNMHNAYQTGHEDDRLHIMDLDGTCFVKRELRVNADLTYLTLR